MEKPRKRGRPSNPVKKLGTSITLPPETMQALAKHKRETLQPFSETIDEALKYIFSPSELYEEVEAPEIGSKFIRSLISYYAARSNVRIHLDSMDHMCGYKHKTSEYIYDSLADLGNYILEDGREKYSDEYISQIIAIFESKQPNRKPNTLFEELQILKELAGSGDINKIIQEAKNLPVSENALDWVIIYHVVRKIVDGQEIDRVVPQKEWFELEEERISAEYEAYVRKSQPERGD